MMSPLWGLLFIYYMYCYKHIIPTGLYELQRRIIFVKETTIRLQSSSGAKFNRTILIIFNGLKRVIYTNIINSISKIIIIKPTLLVLVGGVVGFKTDIETKNEKAKIVTQAKPGANGNIF